jgi:hypothetical protein
MDSVQKIERRKEIYGCDYKCIHILHIMDILPENSPQSIPVKITYDKYTNTVCMQEAFYEFFTDSRNKQKCILENRFNGRKWIALPSLFDELEAQFKKKIDDNTPLVDIIFRGTKKTELRLRMLTQQVHNIHVHCNKPMPQNFYYIKDFEQDILSPITFEKKGRLDLFQDYFTVNLQGGDVVFCATLNKVRKEQIENYVRKNIFFILYLHPYCDGSFPLLILINQFSAQQRLITSYRDVNAPDYALNTLAYCSIC